MTERSFTATEEAVEQAKDIGLTGGREELEGMARLAAPLTHALGNKRFNNWWLRIEEGKVLEIGRLYDSPPTTKDERTEAQKREAKLRVERAIASHFPRKPPKT